MPAPLGTKLPAPSEFVDGVAFERTILVNAYFVGRRGGPWFLLDTGLPGTAGRIRRAAEQRYGADARPEFILLSHGHFDHAANAGELAAQWVVPVYAHPMEMPYLTGKSGYPPKDPTVGGALGLMSRFFPARGYDFSAHVRGLPDNGSVPGFPEWRWYHTGGHSPGHVSLFRESDRVLLAGDALATMNQDSSFSILTMKREFRRPPAPFTCDWDAARLSVAILAELQPNVVAAGHGFPIEGLETAQRLRDFVRNFEAPQDGRYSEDPARTDENGIVWVPPPVPDPLPKLAAGSAIALGTGLAAGALLRRRVRGSGEGV
ncbi:MAG: MBL fold metallo-hydrolase [Acidobacteria bacterium]|nr:MBL fold metallo-hydrolase [Acidobacteriota bacterium]